MPRETFPCFIALRNNPSIYFESACNPEANIKQHFVGNYAPTEAAARERGRGWGPQAKWMAHYAGEDVIMWRKGGTPGDKAPAAWTIPLPRPVSVIDCNATERGYFVRERDLRPVEVPVG